jgi:hypothetical protein
MVLHPIKDVDVCITYINDKPPNLPVREALLTLGAECVAKPRGSATEAAKDKSDERLKKYREKDDEKERQRQSLFPMTCARRRRKERKRARIEDKLRQIKSLSYNEYYRYQKKEGGSHDGILKHSNSDVLNRQNEHQQLIIPVSKKVQDSEENKEEEREEVAAVLAVTLSVNENSTFDSIVEGEETIILDEKISELMALSNLSVAPVRSTFDEKDKACASLQGGRVSLEKDDLPDELVSSSSLALLGSATDDYKNEDKLEGENMALEDNWSSQVIEPINHTGTQPIHHTGDISDLGVEDEKNDESNQDEIAIVPEDKDSLAEPYIDTMHTFSSDWSGKVYDVDQLIDRGYWDTVALHAVEFRDSQNNKQKSEDTIVTNGIRGKDVASGETILDDGESLSLNEGGFDETLEMTGEPPCVEISRGANDADLGQDSYAQRVTDELDSAEETFRSNKVSTKDDAVKGRDTRQSPSVKYEQSFMGKHGWVGIKAELSEVAQAELEDLKLRNIEIEEKRHREKLEAKKLGVKALVPFWEKVISQEEKEKESKI